MNKENLAEPTHLGAARAVAHAASQLLYRAATANIDPMPGDEHSNLRWDGTSASFQTRILDDADTVVTLGLSPLVLQINEDRLVLDGSSLSAVLEWLDGRLVALGLKPASGVAIPYDLPPEVTSLEALEAVAGLDALAAWFTLSANVLTHLAAELSDINPGPSEVRCWPHHFDIATYVSLEAGDAEEARGIGAGLSPGDGSYNEPYFYINPWPTIAPEKLPLPIAPGHWHTEGFVGSVATGTEILSLANVSKGAAEFVRQSFETGRSLLNM